MRDALTEVQSDFLTTIVKPGRLQRPGKPDLDFHYRERGPERRPAGNLHARPARARAEQCLSRRRAGTAKVDGQNYLVLETGTIQRQDKGSTTPAMIVFDSYALDLSHFGSRPTALRCGRANARRRNCWPIPRPNPT